MAHTAVFIQLYVRILALHRVQTFVRPWDIDADLFFRTCVVTRFALIDILTAPVVTVHGVALWTDAVVIARLIHALVLAEKLREAAFIDIRAAHSL